MNEPPETPFVVSMIPPSLRKWQRGLLVWCLITLPIVLVYAWMNDLWNEHGSTVGAIIGGLLIVGMMCAASLAYRNEWHIDPTAKTASRRRFFLGLGRTRSIAAAEIAEIRVWFWNTSRETPSMYLADVILKETNAALTLASDYTADPVRRTALAVSAALNVPVRDET